jgi:hypothetical protein
MNHPALLASTLTGGYFHLAERKITGILKVGVVRKVLDT